MNKNKTERTIFLENYGHYSKKEKSYFESRKKMKQKCKHGRWEVSISEDS